MKKILCMIMLAMLVLLAACSQDINEPYGNSAADGYGAEHHDATPHPGWQTITATEALGMMADYHDAIILDVRTPAEYREVRIEGAALIPYTEITSRAIAELPDKDAIILIYCRAGRRSAIAAAALAELGFTAVYDFGGLIDWPYETVSG